MTSDSEFENLVNVALRRFAPSVKLEEEAYRVTVEVGCKRVEVLWPKNAEVFFRFEDEGVVLLAESLEYYEGESRPEQLEDVARVVENFLVNATRVTVVGTFLRRTELQYCKDGCWRPIWA